MSTQIGDFSGEENQVIMTDLSNPSNMSSHEELLQEYRRECDQTDERLLLSCYRKTEQGVIKIKDWKPPSMIDLLKAVQSLDTLPDALSDLIQYLINQEDSSIPVPVIQKLVIEKLANNPCESLPNIAGRDTIWPSQAEFVDPKLPQKSIEIISSTSTLVGQQGKDKEAACEKTGPTGFKTDLTASLRVSRTKSKPKVVKPKKLRLVFGKPLKPKGRSKHQKEKSKHVPEKLPAKPQRQKNDNDVSRPKTSDRKSTRLNSSH